MNILNPPSLEDIERVIKQLPKNKAAGPTTKKIPDKWKMSYLYPIPKKEDWEYDLNKTRPIVIMEPCKKILTKLITNRLEEKIRNFNLLKGHNFAAEKYTSTITPIQILNNTIEHVNQHKITFIHFFQDMSKAFDNVDHQRLKIALKCIEQGDPLSPIIWKIFYDPILAHITNNYETDLLTIKTTSLEQINMPNNHHTFMDDTIFISKSKEGIERIASAVNHLYKINNIKVNWNKSGLLIINNKDTSILDDSTVIQQMPKSNTI
ncbi:7801_t:CDS:2 [Entrophospora sp. SA101]|nr:3586_t:CDS:2 [Entrophospora sp. SA101]CAJ0843622.1 7801_t:CDS:2 [Entrophospora sp. SA101]